MASNQSIKFKYVTALPSSGIEIGDIFFVQTANAGTDTSAIGDIYVARTNAASGLVKFTAGVESVTFATSGSPQQGVLTVTNKDGSQTSYNIASRQELSDLATALRNEIADLDVEAFTQASVANGSGTTGNTGATITINGISETDGKIATSTTTKTDIPIVGTGSVTVNQSSGTITINGADSGVTSITQGDGITVTNGSSSSPTISANVTAGNGLSIDSSTHAITMAKGATNAPGAATADGTTTTIDSDGKIGINSNAVDGTISTTGTVNKLATQSTVTTAIGALDSTATIASETSGIVTIKTGITETDGKIANDSGTDITLAKVATTGKAEDVRIDDTAGKFTASDVENALLELKNDIAAVHSFDIVVVQTLPTASESTMNKIYLVPKPGSPQEAQNIKEEYITVETQGSPSTYAWEKIGDTEIDLSDYVEKTTTIAGVDLQDNITKTELLTALNVADGAQVNTIEGVQVNGTDLTPDSNKKVNVTITTPSTPDGTITVNGTSKTVYTHPTSGVTAGTYRSVTVDANGHVTAGTNPTTVDSVSLASGTNNGTLKLTVNGTATDNIAVTGLGDAAYKGVATASGSDSSDLTTVDKVQSMINSNALTWETWPS